MARRPNPPISSPKGASAGYRLAVQMLAALRRRAAEKLKAQVRNQDNLDLSTAAAEFERRLPVDKASYAIRLAYCLAPHFATAKAIASTKALVLMEKNIATPLEIAVLARLVNSSSRQLERVFLAETGCTPSEQYRRLRLKYARYLLTTTDLPILAIAVESGFSDSSHFIRHFQLMYGMPPGRLRKAMQPTPPDTAGVP